MSNRFTCSAAWLFAALCLMCFTLGAHAQAWELQSDRWYVLQLSGVPCGLSHESVHRRAMREGAAQLRTTGDVEMRFRRLGQVTQIALHSEFIENSRGEPLEASVSQDAGTVVRWTFDAKHKRATKQQGAAPPEPFPWPANAWLTPRGVEQFLSARLRAGAKEISYTSIDLQSGCVPATVTMTRLDAAEGEGLFEIKNSLVPLIARERYAIDGVLLSSAMPIGIGDLTSTLATEREAHAALAAGNFDLLQGTLIACAPIPNVTRLSRANFRVTTTSPSIALPDVASQIVRVDAKSPQEAIVEIDVDRANAAAASDALDPRWTQSNTLIDAEHAAVKSLLAQAKCKLDDSARVRAEKLRRLVESHLRSKDFKTAFGSASEAAISRSGDCTEHAVLLAALCRADGIPSRVVSGVVYVEGAQVQGSAWGWHMWTQALVDVQGATGKQTSGVWMDLDATLSTRFHAAHIAVAVSDLSAGAADPAFLGALALIGKMKIELVPAEPKHDH
ncbi:MAG: hypothetical protein EXS10_02540 [Phycisphaerales bacterium]|nr:hypothetical protein [Phycisphaerales bacterium]